MIVVNAHTPKKNELVERMNKTLIEKTCSMHILAKALDFLWTEVINIVAILTIEAQ